jgi:hypothetical protein
MLWSLNAVRHLNALGEGHKTKSDGNVSQLQPMSHNTSSETSIAKFYLHFSGFRLDTSVRSQEVIVIRTKMHWNLGEF